MFGKSSSATVDLAALGSEGFRIDGAARRDRAGASVSGAGDVNGDGRPDVIVGAPGAASNGRAASGSAYVVFGGSPPAPCEGAGAITDGSPGDTDPDPNEVAGGPGRVYLKGGSGDDFIQGGGAGDLLCGGGGNDTILDGSAQDRVFGEGGNDVLGAGTGKDTYSGGSGQDRVSYATRSAGVIAYIGTARGNGESGENDTIDEDIEDLNGGRGSDELIGDEDANLLTGGPGSGNDQITGNGAADRIRGGEGDDSMLAGGDGNDTIEGNGGTDQLIDGDGADLLLGGDGDTHELSTNGERDYANCGAGANDRAVPREPVDRANRNCEIRESRSPSNEGRDEKGALSGRRQPAGSLAALVSML